MDIKKITDQISVSGQICAADVEAVAKAGFRSILCNRPDGEAEDQPTFADIEAAATKLGLNAHYMPVQSGGITDQDIEDFSHQIATLDGPVLAYCRSGARCSTLWTKHAE